MTGTLPADIKDPKRRKKILEQLLQNCEERIAELEDRKALIEHELRETP